jgi:hypothetical protein
MFLIGASEGMVTGIKNTRSIPSYNPLFFLIKLTASLRSWSLGRLHGRWRRTPLEQGASSLEITGFQAFLERGIEGLDELLTVLLCSIFS